MPSVSLCLLLGKPSQPLVSQSLLLHRQFLSECVFQDLTALRWPSSEPSQMNNARFPGKCRQPFCVCKHGWCHWPLLQVWLQKNTFSRAWTQVCFLGWLLKGLLLTSTPPPRPQPGFAINVLIKTPLSLWPKPVNFAPSSFLLTVGYMGLLPRLLLLFQILFISIGFYEFYYTSIPAYHSSASITVFSSLFHQLLATPKDQFLIFFFLLSSLSLDCSLPLMTSTVISKVLTLK